MKKHRKTSLLPVLAILLACLSGCGGRAGEPPDMEAVLEEIREQVELPDMYRLTEKRIRDRYGLDAAAMEQAIVLVCENGLQVESDNAKGMETLAGYVLDKGHRRVAYIRGEEGEVTRKRYGGFCAAFEKRGLDPQTAVCFQARYRAPETCMAALDEILRMEDRPTCIFFPDDFSCAAGVGLLHTRGIRVPEDISAAGYDGIEVGRVMHPRLTTYRQDTSCMAETAVRMLLEAMGGRTEEGGALFTAEGCLIPGETVREI